MTFFQAWIRIAINDGVLESYLDAMLADPKTVRYFYDRIAYLRDSEHPGILKTYIQGKVLLSMFNTFITVQALHAISQTSFQLLVTRR